jgi:hypothetical protein
LGKGKPRGKETVRISDAEMISEHEGLGSALIVSTSTASNQYESGGSLRIIYLKKILEIQGLNVIVVSKDNLKKISQKSFKVIVLSSYACANLGFWARKRTSILWFDPYDSWGQHRKSMLYIDFPKNLLGWLRDVFWTSIFPQCEIVTFISEKDKLKEKKFSKFRKTYVLPIHFALPRKVTSKQPKLVFVGDGGYKPNTLCLPTLELIGKTLNMRVSVIGRNYEKFLSEYTQLDFLGYLDSSEIYCEKDIHISPSSLGTGIKTKTVFPLALGLNVVASRVSSNGIRNLGNLRVAETIDEYCKAIQKILDEQLDTQNIGFNQLYEVDDAESVLNFLKVELSNNIAEGQSKLKN